MIALKIIDVKKFMEKLLVSPMFDSFLLFSADINVSISWHLEGMINESYYSSDECELMNQRSHALWSEVRPHIFQLIKGKKTPCYLKIVFMLNGKPLEEYFNTVNQTSNSISSLFLNIKFDSSGLTIITGVAQTSFSMDKTLENTWDQSIKQFLVDNQISWEQ